MKISNKHKFSFFPIRWLLIVYDVLIYAAVIVFAFIIYRRPATEGGVGLEWLQILWHFLIGSACVTLARFFWRVYGQIWRYGGVQSYIRLMVADTCALIVYWLIQRFVPGVGNVGFVVVTLIIFANTLICLAVRMVYRLVYKKLNRATKFGRFVTKMVNIFGRSN